MPILSSFDHAMAGGDPPASNRTSPSGAAPALRALGAERFAAGPALPERQVIRTLLNGSECRISTEFVHAGRFTGTRRAAQLAGDAGGFEARTFCVPVTTAQIWLTRCPNAGRAAQRLQVAAAELLQDSLCNERGQRLPTGCIPGLTLIDHGHGTLEVSLHVERVDEVCSQALKVAACAVGNRLAAFAESRPPEIEIGILESERVRVRCRLPRRCLAPEHTRRSLIRASGIRRAVTSPAAPAPPPADGPARVVATDRHQPALAALHNDQVLDGLAAAAAGAHVDPVAVLQPARAYSARWGSCEPLTRWRISGDVLLGQLCMPVDLVAIGDSISSRQDVSFQTVRAVADRIAAVGLAASVAYLRATLMAVDERER